MDEVFKALADPSRRRLLDKLLGRDGLTLGELADGAGMSRFGVMKHLAVLEAAGLVRTERMGRLKLHHLETGPLVSAHRGWLRQFIESRARRASA